MKRLDLYAGEGMNHRTGRFHRFTAGLLCFIMLLTVTLTIMPLTAFAATPTPLTFTAEADDSSVTLNYVLGSDVMYKTGDAAWTAYAEGTEISLDKNETVSFKGIGVTTNSGNHFTMTGNISASGDVTSLTNGIGGDATLTDFCYYFMFSDCTSLTEAPELPATTMAKNCYYFMFYACTSLTIAPELPATALATYCYNGMFYDCTGLTTAPKLPAITLADYCYYRMFDGCTRLTEAPKLPATTMAAHCYQRMFFGCTSLTSPPELPATTLADHCYYYMFDSCTRLTTAPELLATTLADHCYNSMFYGCTSLTEAPALSATTLANYCYYRMFYGCTSLKISATETGDYTKEWRIPATKSITLTADSWNTNMLSGTGGTFTENPKVDTTYYIYEEPTPLTFTAEADDSSVTLNYVSGTNVMYKLGSADWVAYEKGNAFELDKNETVSFKGIGVTTDSMNHFTMTGEIAASGDVTSLTNGIGGDATLSVSCYYRMFDGCTSLSAAPELPTTALADRCYYDMFEGCTNLTTAPELPATTLADSCYYAMFGCCTSLTTAPDLPATTLADRCYYDMFEGCTNLTTAPELPATTLATNCYSGMFYDCTSLTIAPELPATTLATNCYYAMFGCCTSLTTAPDLPATTLADYCYYVMFEGCTNLTTAPELPATTLATNCYSGMFECCTNLTTAPELPATTLATNCYSGMFYDCTSLTIAPELPATTLADSCYYAMFGCCTSLTTAPDLPATTLADYCYYVMFEGCTNLTTAPELPATTLADYCYRRMFSGCTSLKISITKTDEYTKEWRIPTTETITTTASAWNTDMLAGTGGTFTENPKENITYYIYEDNTPPVVSGIENGKTYCETAEFTVTDDNLNTVVINGTISTASTENYKLIASGTNTVVATDKAGNSTTVTVIINENHTYDNNCDATCNVCGKPRTVPHNWETEWSSDGTNHWHECSSCNEKKDVAVHTPDEDDSDCTTAVHCTVCNAVTADAQSHNFTGAYDGYDATHHWHICNRDRCDGIDAIVLHSGGTATYFEQAICAGCGQKYGSTTADVTAPIGEIAISANHWNEFLNTGTFGLFFKEIKTVTVTVADAESGVAKIEYLLSNTVFETENAITGTWKDITASKQFNLIPNSKQYIYVRLTDVAGNTAIINSEGVVVYSDSAVSPVTATFDKNVVNQADIDFTMTLNGNTFKDIKNGTAALISGTDYTVSGTTVTVKKAYFASQANGDVALTFSFYPMGVENNENLSISTAAITVSDTTHYHSMSYITARVATHLAVGNTEYWYCNVCHKYFSDTAGTTEITLADTVVEKLTEHTFDKEVIDGRYLKSEANCESAAVYYKSCECGEHGTETFTSGDKNPANHTSLVKTDAVPATHFAVGNTEYWYCDGCHKYFSEEDGTTEITLADIVVPKLTEHTFDKEVVDGRYLKSEANCESAAVYYKSCECGEHGTETFTSGDKNQANHTSLVKTDAVPATHLAVGNTEYWYCDGCHKYFSDTAGTTEITLADTVVEKLTEHTADASGWHFDEDGHWHICTCGDIIGTVGHSFGDWTITTEATATEKGIKERICSACGYKETAEIAATGGIPQTGDNNNVFLWMVFLLVSGGAVPMIGITGKRRRAAK